MGLDITVRKLGRKSDFIGKQTEDITVDDCYYSLSSLSDYEDSNNIYYDSEIPDWALNLKEIRNEAFYDWDKYKENTGIDIHDYEFGSWGCDADGKSSFVFYNKVNHDKLEIPDEDIPSKYEDIYVIYFDPVNKGYMRKGLNDNYYEDYDMQLCHYLVFERLELLRILDEYVLDDRKDQFIHNILDNFIEGEDVVEFNW